MRSPIKVAAVLSILVAALVVLASTTRTLRARAVHHFAATQTYEDVYYLPPARWLPVLSLGWDEALASVVWLRALVYFGEELNQRGRARYVFDYADAILTLDPFFLRAYRWVGTTGMYRPAEAGVSVDDIRQATSYLERATNLFPDDGKLAWETGASLAYELAPLIEDVSERERIRGRGIEYMMTAARLGAAPEWQVFTNATQLRRLGQTDRAIRHLEEMYDLVDDSATRAQIELELQRLRSAAEAEALREAHEQLERQRLRDFPYLQPTLYLLVGPRTNAEHD